MISEQGTGYIACGLSAVAPRRPEYHMVYHIRYLPKHNDVDIVVVTGFQSTPYRLLGEPFIPKTYSD